MMGFIKAFDQQNIAAVASFLSMILVSVPIGYVSGFLLDMKLPGLMIGYGLQGLILIIVYGIILVKLNWQNAALQASL
jgi:Na+-driven multidrug efflux pump